MTQGDLVKAKVQVKNEIGWSDFSPEVADVDAIAVQTVPHKPNPPTRGSSTSSTQIQIDWTAISAPENGGADISSYNLQFDQGTSGLSWVSLTGDGSSFTDLTYTHTDNVIAGRSYQFLLKAENIHGPSEASNTESIIAATVPSDISSPVTTSLSGSKVRFTWDKPFNGGLAIQSYTVQFKENGGSYSTSSECIAQEGSTSDTYYCEVEMLTFSSVPFSLAVNSLIVAQVKAVNSYGPASSFSPDNTLGITVKTKPLSPPSAPSEGTNTAYNQVEIILTAVTGSNTGESDILSYEIYWNQGSLVNTYVSLDVITATTDATQTYLQTSGLTQGITYQYKYRAINVYGEGDFSDPVSIVPKSAPAQISDVTLTLSTRDVVITWTEPDNRGDTITKYRITFLDKADSSYKEVSSFCGLADSSPHTTTT